MKLGAGAVNLRHKSVWEGVWPVIVPGISRIDYLRLLFQSCEHPIPSKSEVYLDLRYRTSTPAS